MAKTTFGTGSFVLLNTGFTVPEPRPGLLATVAWGDRRPLRTTYALEASIFVTGAAVQWLRDELRIIERAEDTEALAASLAANDGVYFVPALTGLGSPHWDPHARGTIVGLTRGHRSRPSGARDARGDRLPDASTPCARWRPPPGSRSASCAPTAARARTLADAVPGRRARRAGRAGRDRRDDRARRGLPGGGRRGAVDDLRRARLLAGARALRAADGRGRARRSARGLGGRARARA